MEFYKMDREERSRQMKHLKNGIDRVSSGKGMSGIIFKPSDAPSFLSKSGKEICDYGLLLVMKDHDFLMLEYENRSLRVESSYKDDTELGAALVFTGSDEKIRTMHGLCGDLGLLIDEKHAMEGDDLVFCLYNTKKYMGVIMGTVSSEYGQDILHLTLSQVEGRDMFYKIGAAFKKRCVSEKYYGDEDSDDDDDDFGSGLDALTSFDEEDEEDDDYGY